MEKLTALLDKFMHDSKMHAGVFVQRPYSLTVAFGCGRAVILDSHTHQVASCQRGAPVAVSGSTASTADIAAFIVDFLAHVPYTCARCTFVLLRD